VLRLTALRSRASAWALTTTIVLSAGLAACAQSPTESSPGHSSSQLHAGVVHEEVDDTGGLVHELEVFHPADVGELSDEVMGRLADGETVVVDGGPRGHDTTIIYRTGPYCGLLPNVRVEATNGTVEVVSRGRDDVPEGVGCPAMEFGEALGIVWADPYEGQAVVARHHLP
jgi:hypothetical protein